ncbi:MAG: ABC transporter substrate-binding protein [Candidatus Humimicrobiaceae bacterium]
MKRKWIIIAAMVLAIAMLFSLPLAGCKTTSATTTAAASETTAAAATTTTPASETKKVEGAVLSMMHDKGGNPNYQPYFEEMGAKTKEVLGIDIKPVGYPTTDVFMATVRAALTTKEAPDLFTWWSTYRMKELIDQDLLAETTDLWQKHKDEYSQGLIDAFTFNGKAYGFSYTQEYWPVWYNKDVFSKLGLSEPQTWDEFLKVCEVLKSNGITPMAQSIQGRWPSFIMFEQMIIGEDPNLYVDLCEGKVNYTDAKVKKAFEVWKDLIDKGYFTDPATDLFADVPALFNNDKVGMVLTGTWYYESVFIANSVPSEKIGAFILPSHNPAAGKNIVLEMSPIVISKNAPYLTDALKVADYLMGPEGNAVFAKLNKSYPSNMKSDTSFLPEIKTKIASTVKDEQYRILNRYWEATPTPICEAAVDKFAEFIANPKSLDKILSDLDAIANQYWKK